VIEPDKDCEFCRGTGLSYDDFLAISIDCTCIHRDENVYFVFGGIFIFALVMILTIFKLQGFI
jgi:hypothetical protein